MKKKYWIFIFLLFMIFVVIFTAYSSYGETISEESINLSDEVFLKIDKFVLEHMKAGKIPGLSIAIVKDDKTVYKKSFGYVEFKSKQPVTSETLFELGSTSKAFTALAVLDLEKKGLLNLDDPVNKYLPWFFMNYEGWYKGKNITGPAKITINNLIYHTSGVPFKTIGDIPIASNDRALEDTVKVLVGQKLDFYPGEKFQYATINYDVLGLIIQQITGQDYESYIKDHILTPLGLEHTYLSIHEAKKNGMSIGHKVNFLGPKPYDAPIYRGNTPAGYIITSIEDVAKWLKIQLGTSKRNKLDDKLIEKSHEVDRTVPPQQDGASYAYGWFVYQKGSGEISHGGENPNYSSFIVFRPDESIGVAVLANINSSYTKYIGQGVINIIKGDKLTEPIQDFYINIDNVSVTIICIATLMIVITLWYVLTILIQIIKKKRRFYRNLKKLIFPTIFSVLFIVSFAYCLYRIPDVLYWGLPWDFVKVWAPQSFIIAVFLIFITVTIFILYYGMTIFFPSEDDRSLFSICILSTFSGFGNAAIIFIINEALNRTSSFQAGLVLFFVMAIVIYVYGQRLVRARLIKITNDLVYHKRVLLINKLLNTSYENFQGIEDGSIQAGLNNDTETISNFANTTITSLTRLVTLLCCFIYLGIINFYGLMVSILVIFVAAGMYFVAGRSANRFWEKTRDTQNTFVKLINDLIGGFKELNINRCKRQEFEHDIVSSCRIYRDNRVSGDLKFANVFVAGELLFTLVIGVVAFAFPIVFKDIQNSTLRNYIFVYLYMTGPVNGVLNSIPNIIRIRISWKRLNEFCNQIEITKRDELRFDSKDTIAKSIELKLKGIEYCYRTNDENIFSVGPISCGFKSGEITFITGGNGSGKSTLAKLITGLYEPDKGEIVINDVKLCTERLRQNYSTIFSDFYLFDKLYGIDYTSKRNNIYSYLKKLHIDDKLEIIDGIFSTTKLSAGQRKRLALMVSYLEDRPIYLFDEWAADQDPEFRRYFYYELLPELKKKGKCVIAITHDDGYFDLADRVIKMDMGRIVQNVKNVEVPTI